MIVMGFLAGFYISFGGIFALTVSYGSPNLSPGIQKLLIGITFPLALFSIVFLGGELFTGNVMYCTVGLLSRKIGIKTAVIVCGLSFICNFIGCVAGGYFFGYLTEVFEADPWNSSIKKLAITKTSMGFGVVFLRAVAANWLVNIAIFVVLVGDDITHKAIGLFYPICAFATSGFEHCVANMFYVPLGLMYGADVTIGKFLYANLIPATLGNIFGGAFFVGALLYYIHFWRVDCVNTDIVNMKDLGIVDSCNETEGKKETICERNRFINVSCFP